MITNKIIMNTNEEKNQRNRSFNFYLKDEIADNRVFGNSDISTADANKHYIILQNDTLQTKCYELEKQKNEIQKTCDEFEEEVDKYDESGRYMRNELKNFVELRKMEHEISVLFEDKYKEYQKLHLELLNIIKIICIFIIFFRLLDSAMLYFIIYTSFDDIYSLLGVADVINILNLICYVFFGQEFKTARSCIKQFNINMDVLDKTIKQKREEIKKTDDSNDFISKYIDNL